MDGIFKQKLLGLRNPPMPKTFSEALLGDTSWLQRKTAPKAAPAPSREAFSEKAQVIESFERFAQEKVEETKTNILKIDGGEIVVRSNPEWEEVSVYDGFESLTSHLKLDAELKNIVFNNK